MKDITKKIFEIDEQKIDFTDEFKQRIEQIFNEAVEDSNESAYISGIEDVLKNMKKHGMANSADIVLKNLVADGIVEVEDLEDAGSEGNHETNESMTFAEIVAGQIG